MRKFLILTMIALVAFFAVPYYIDSGTANTPATQNWMTTQTAAAQTSAASSQNITPTSIAGDQYTMTAATTPTSQDYAQMAELRAVAPNDNVSVDVRATSLMNSTTDLEHATFAILRSTASCNFRAGIHGAPASLIV